MPGTLTIDRPSMAPPPDTRQPVIVSYLTLRRVVGVLGVSLPVVLALWGFSLLGGFRILLSISDYYALRTRDVFVGTLFTIAWFLFTYRGYDRRDDVAGNWACLFAIGTALFPNTGTRFERAAHFASASLLFLVLAYFSLFLFTKTSGTPTRMKRARNEVYRLCGVLMLACIGLIGVYKLGLDESPLQHLKPVFWLESLALWAFGVSWFVKGETILTDE